MRNPAATSAAQPQWPRAVIFDFDGLLADTAARWTAAYKRCLLPRGQQPDAATLAALAGASVENAARRLEVPAQELRSALTDTFREHPLTEMPGASRLVQALSARARLAIATNGPHALVRLGLQQLGLSPYFNAIVSAEQIGIYKPNPDVYLQAAAAVGADPSDCVALEDSAVGAEAARRAGLLVIHIPCNNDEHVDADLRAPRLDDAQVLHYLGADQTGAARPTQTSLPR